jgi:Asp-tRNA(Asn)/Glu-tRNA(Gln) amidotransferase A subunit family amidase
MQLIAGAFDEPRLLATAYAYEQTTDWHMRKPVLSEGWVGETNK